MPYDFSVHIHFYSHFWSDTSKTTLAKSCALYFSFFANFLDICRDFSTCKSCLPAQNPCILHHFPNLFSIVFVYIFTVKCERKKKTFAYNIPYNSIRRMESTVQLHRLQVLLSLSGAFHLYARIDYIQEKRCRTSGIFWSFDYLCNNKSDKSRQIEKQGVVDIYVHYANCSRLALVIPIWMICVPLPVSTIKKKIQQWHGF